MRFSSDSNANYQQLSLHQLTASLDVPSFVPTTEPYRVLPAIQFRA
jgi:hypothetical protein